MLVFLSALIHSWAPCPVIGLPTKHAVSSHEFCSLIWCTLWNFPTGEGNPSHSPYFSDAVPRVVFYYQLSLVLIAFTQGGMARLRWPVSDKGRAGCWVREGVAPPAVRVRGYHPLKLFLKTQMLNLALWWLLCLLLWNFLLFENYVQDVGDQYIVGRSRNVARAILFMCILQSMKLSVFWLAYVSYNHQNNSAFHPSGVDKWVVGLFTGHVLRWRHLVNAYKVISLVRLIAAA